MKISRHFFLFLTASLISSCFNPSTQATQSTPTSIPTPTIQPAPFLDFDHPRLHEIAGDKPLIIREIIRTRRYFEGTPYAAIIVDTDDPVFKAKMLIFRLETPNALLIYESDAYVYISFDITAVDPIWLMDNSNYYFVRSLDGIGGFGSSYLEVPFEVSNGGNCYDCSGMKVIGINKEDGAVKDITPISKFNPKTFINLGEKLELPFYIIATRYYEFDYGACDHVSSPFAFHIFAWNEDADAYVDVSENEKEFYDQKIAELTTFLQTRWGGPFHACWIMPTLANIFFNYESSGRVDIGWEQIKSLGDLSHWDINNTEAEEIQSYHDVFDMLEQRKNEDQATPAPQ